MSKGRRYVFLIGGGSRRPTPEEELAATADRTFKNIAALARERGFDVPEDLIEQRKEIDRELEKLESRGDF